MSNNHRRARGQRGAAAVEFAIIAPVFLMLVLGCLDFGLMLGRRNAVNNSAREGARLASLGESRTDIESAVKASLDGMGTPTVTITCTTPTAAGCGSYDSDAAAGGTAIVTVELVTPWLTPVGRLAGDGGDATLTRTVRMRIE